MFDCCSGPFVFVFVPHVVVVVSLFRTIVQSTRYCIVLCTRRAMPSVAYRAETTPFYFYLISKSRLLGRGPSPPQRGTEGARKTRGMALPVTCTTPFSLSFPSQCCSQSQNTQTHTHTP